MSDFQAEVHTRVAANDANEPLKEAARAFMRESIPAKYSYNFSWLGRPVIQYPQDIVAMQELVWRVKPDLIIEAGIAHGGSLVLSASLLAMLDMEEAILAGTSINPNISKRKVLGVDIDIRPHNRKAIEEHVLSSRIQMLQGSSVAPEVIEQVRAISGRYERVLVCLDSNHTHDHVLAELEAYAPMTSAGSYCIVFDTVVEDLPKSMFPDRPWGPGDNPKTAVWEYVKHNPNFVVDRSMDSKLMISVAPDGFLRRMK